MANIPINVYDNTLPNAEGNLGSAVPTGSKYILTEIALANSGAGVNRVQIRTATGATKNILDVSLPPAASPGASEPFRFAMVLPAATQLMGLATTAGEVHAMISAIWVV